MPELGPYGSVRGALSNERPYRDLRNVVAKYPFERSHRFAGMQPSGLQHRCLYTAPFRLQSSDIAMGPLGVLGNLVWLLVAGWWLALGHLITTVLLACTIVGIPFAWAHVKLAGLALWPIGKMIVPHRTHPYDTRVSGDAIMLSCGNELARQRGDVQKKPRASNCDQRSGRLLLNVTLPCSSSPTISSY
jgi:hypothetical protein